MSSGSLRFTTELDTLMLREGVDGVFEIEGIAIHPVTTRHPEDPEWVKCRQYLEPELIKAAPSLAGKPINMDHSTIPLIGCKITESAWDTEQFGVHYRGVVTKPIADMIRNRQIKHVSVNVDWLRPGGGLKFVNGISPFNFEFEGLSLLRLMDPGDPGAFVKLAEAITPESEEFFLISLKDPAGFINGKFTTVWIDRELGVQGWHGRTAESESMHLIALIFQKGKGWTDEKIQQWRADNPQYFNEPAKPAIQTNPVLEEGLRPIRVLTPSERWRMDHRRP